MTNIPPRNIMVASVGELNENRQDKWQQDDSHCRSKRCAEPSIVQDALIPKSSNVDMLQMNRSKVQDVDEIR